MYLLYLQSDFRERTVPSVMKPCKFVSPSFAVTAAILGGIALATSTCQSSAATIIAPVATYTAFDPFHNPTLTFRQIDEDNLFQDTESSRMRFIFDPLLLDGLQSVTLRLNQSGRFPPNDRQLHYLSLFPGLELITGATIPAGRPRLPGSDYGLLVFSRQRTGAPVIEWDITEAPLETILGAPPRHCTPCPSTSSALA